MHTTSCGLTRFIHNGDYSGDIEIRAASGSVVTVPASDIFQFVAEWVRAEKIRWLEEASGREILNLEREFSDKGGRT